MVINIERKYNTPAPKIVSENDYINKIGARKFVNHFSSYEPKDYEKATRTASGSALAFMLSSYVSDDIPETKLLINELARRLCKDEAEYKKYFGSKTNELVCDG